MILYLHGLNSGAGSKKAAEFRQRLTPIPVFSPSYPAHLAEQAVQSLGNTLSSLISQNQGPLVLIGSSMGGFYGQILVRRFPVDHLVMINPALQPWELLKQVVGWQYNAAQDERYYLSAEMVEATRAFGLEPKDLAVPITLLLDDGDELINSKRTAVSYAGFADVRLFPGGSHAFEHMDEAVSIVRKIYEAFSSGS